jgi:hypothetical protein
MIRFKDLTIGDEVTIWIGGGIRSRVFSVKRYEGSTQTVTLIMNVNGITTLEMNNVQYKEFCGE